MKRTCAGCKALEVGYYCSLGYDVEVVCRSGLTVDVKPKEECPKPKTNKEFVNTPNKRDR